ncbi:MAG: flippase-like domain-containing protein, partial [Gemmatimonadetes bacterium]|nr:flippase-like domain-containing protein [Gemmatimonadota bacterium]
LMTVLLVATGWALAGQWGALKAAVRGSSVDWGWIGASTLFVLGTHAMLVQAWRLLLEGWGGRLSYGAAVQVWTIANLGRWIPGKVWSVGALGVLAERAGVNAIAAYGAALLGTALNLGAGCAVAMLLGAQALRAINPIWGRMVWIGLVAFLVAVAVLPRLLPVLLGRFARRRGVPMGARQLRAARLWSVVAVHFLSWVGYGVAFWLFTRGVAPAISGNPIAFIAVYAASYLAGYLVLIAPGGVGVREGTLAALLVSMGMASRGDAVLLGILSRGWLTVLEILPGLVSLLLLPRDSRTSLRRTG